MNELQQGILLWGSIVGAGTGIIVAIVKVAQAIKTVVEYFASIKENVDTLLKHDRAQYMAILRLTVMSDNIPLSERIMAGKEYIDNDGNGDVRHYYETKLKPHDTIND